MSTVGTATWAAEVYGPKCRTSVHTVINFCGRMVPIHKGCVRHFRYLARLFQEKTPAYAARIEARADTGTYNCRFISGTTIPSLHSWPLCIDVLWQENARDGDGTFLDSSVWKEARSVIFAWEKSGGRWGGRYSEPDPMHFETLLTPEEIRERFTPTGKLRTEKTIVRIRAIKRVSGWAKAKATAKRLRKRGYDVDLKKAGS